MPKQNFSIFIVDDSASTRLYLRSLLEPIGYKIFEYADGELCIANVSQFNPSLIILDIEMSGKNGIETCKELRKNGYEQQILFFSSNDDWNVRLLAYDVGGNDFIQKGTEQDLLEIKVKLAEQAEANKVDLQDRLLFSQNTAHSAIASLGETGIVLHFLRKSFACHTLVQIANALIEAVAQFDLNAIVALNGNGTDVYRNMHEACNPLEVSILNRLSQLGRIYEAPDRIGINYPHAQLLLSGLSNEDSEKIGRLRDHLALICEGADARVISLEQQLEKDKQHRLITNTSKEMSELVADISMSQNANHARLVTVIDNFRSNLDNLFFKLGLSENQEMQLHQLANQLYGETSEIFQQELEVSERLNQIIKQQKKKLLSARRSKKWDKEL